MDALAVITSKKKAQERCGPWACGLCGVKHVVEPFRGPALEVSVGFHIMDKSFVGDVFLPIDVSLNEILARNCSVVANPSSLGELDSRVLGAVDLNGLVFVDVVPTGRFMMKRPFRVTPDAVELFLCDLLHLKTPLDMSWPFACSTKP